MYLFKNQTSNVLRQFHWKHFQPHKQAKFSSTFICMPISFCTREPLIGWVLSQAQRSRFSLQSAGTVVKVVSTSRGRELEVQIRVRGGMLFRFWCYAAWLTISYQPVVAFDFITISVNYFCLLHFSVPHFSEIPLTALPSAELCQSASSIEPPLGSPFF